MQYLLIFLILLVVLIVIAWIGFRILPRPFPMPSLPKFEPGTAPLPGDLPAPVERFFQKKYSGQVLRIETVVITGRGRIRPFGIWLPARFVFVHQTGQAYRHYIEATFLGMPFLKVNEGYLDGKSFFESPMGTYHNDPNTNQGANLALWAEAGWFPSVWVTDPRVQWQAVDDHTALLFVPFENQMENFVVRFNPQTGLVDLMEAMRYREPGEGKPKTLWITRNETGVQFAGKTVEQVGSATWMDQGKPWAVFYLENLEINVDVNDYIRQRGA
jgi:hypothetical protein